MAKVVLVWNEHPTEVVAGYHCRAVAEILRKRYGHKVVIKKIPVGKTYYGIVSKVSNAEEAAIAANKLRKLKPSIERAQAFSKTYNAPVFNFHCSDRTVMGEAAKRTVSKFRIGKPDERKDKFHSEIGLHGNKRKGGFVVEVPAAFMLFKNNKLAERRFAQILTVFSSAKQQSKRTAMQITSDLTIAYHTGTTPLKHPEQQKYLSPAISEKIAQAIHERITERRK